MAEANDKYHVIYTVKFLDGTEERAVIEGNDFQSVLHTRQQFIESVIYKGHIDNAVLSPPTQSPPGMQKPYWFLWLDPAGAAWDFLENLQETQWKGWVAEYGLERARRLVVKECVRYLISRWSLIPLAMAAWKYLRLF